MAMVLAQPTEATFVRVVILAALVQSQLDKPFFDDFCSSLSILGKFLFYR